MICLARPASNGRRQGALTDFRLLLGRAGRGAGRPRQGDHRRRQGAGPPATCCLFDPEQFAVPVPDHASRRTAAAPTPRGGRLETTTPRGTVGRLPCVIAIADHHAFFCCWLLVRAPSLYTVDRTEYVYLTQFGRHVATSTARTRRGRPARQAGPGRSSRCSGSTAGCNTFDLPGAELLTRDPQGNTIDKTLTVDAYVCWRIAGQGRRGPVHPRGRHAGAGADDPRPAHQQRARGRHRPDGDWTTSSAPTRAGWTRQPRRTAADGCCTAASGDAESLQQARAARSTASRSWTSACAAPTTRRRSARRSSTASAASANKKAAEYQQRGREAGRGHHAAPPSARCATMRSEARRRGERA